MIYSDGTVTVVSGSSIVNGKGTKWNSNNPLVSPGMLMLIKNGDINYPYMILSVNSDTELNLADKPTFSATDTTYTINLTEPENNSDAARALVAANTYIIYFLQNMDLWMTENGVVEITLPSGKTVKLESIKALQELVEGKADASSVKEIKDALESKADVKDVTEKLDTKYDKSGGEITGDVQLNTGKIKAKNANAVTDHAFQNKSGTLMHVGDFGFGGIGPQLNLTEQQINDYLIDKERVSHIFRNYNNTKFSYSYSPIIYSMARDTFVALTAAHDGRGVKIIGGILGGSAVVYNIMTNANTTYDSNGFLKRASPIVKIHPDGSFEMNDESEGVNVQRTGVGKYFISGVMGYNSDGAWGINDGVSVPKNSNGLELIYIKDKILPDGNIEIQTFHRQHSHLPEDFQNFRIKEIIDGKPIYYADGEQVDIPMSTWLDVRVEMPVDSVWQQKQHLVKQN
ncbi:hypothetical protein [Arsenophonus nasoniae]|uniref:Phage tail protein C-terminal domain-containing protein n=1 Tax=Arsenophonus nasoniae TaxID=638 RepID=A0AA95GBV0_9GAMM|nr:hypothetical protein [Arsenophonus nasoniae]WGL93743.1 hypothetical protein QE207_00325 [Arsenophonus nasoniae]WGL96045.1 hypothetical protein QE207_05520 [Arsenophonus nasoniae]